MQYTVAWVTNLRATSPEDAARKAWVRMREADPDMGSADTVMHVAPTAETRVGFPLREARLIDVSGTALKKKPKKSYEGEN